ncbi:MAG: hypothetical protein ACP5HH_05565 [Fervidicoccaceae archaeon]
MRRLLVLLFLAFTVIELCFTTLSPLAATAVPKEVTFYELGESTCPHCVALLNTFAQNFPNNTYFCDIATNQACLVRFYSWLNFSSFPASVPQTFVIYNKTYILAIVLGEVDNATFWSNIANSAPNNVQFPIYIGEQLWGYINATPVAQQYIINTFLYPSQQTTTTTETFTSTQTSTPLPGGGISYRSFITTLASLAITDAVNICVISIYSLLLLMIATRKSRKIAAISGLLFTAGVFTGYMLLGLGLLKVISAFGGVPTQILRYILVAYGALLVASSFYTYARRKRCKVCKDDVGFLGKFFSAGRWVEKSPLLHFVFGLLLSIALIPCSAGPYVVFLVILSSITGVARILYLLVYVLIFVAPLLVFLEIVILAMKSIPEDKVAVVRSIIVPIAGILLIVVALGFI